LSPGAHRNGGATNPRTLRPIRRMFTRNGSDDSIDMSWEQLRDFDLYGSVEDVISKIERLQEAGASAIMCWFGYGGMPDAMVRSAMQMFAREVMPLFQRSQAYRRLRR
jgi:hypothetical protein